MQENMPENISNKWPERAGKKSFTLEERKIIEECLEKGMNNGQIARILGRNSTSIYSEIDHHGGARAYNAIDAHHTPGVRPIKGNLGKEMRNLDKRITQIESKLDKLINQLRDALGIHDLLKDTNLEES